MLFQLFCENTQRPASKQHKRKIIPPDFHLINTYLMWQPHNWNGRRPAFRCGCDLHASLASDDRFSQFEFGYMFVAWHAVVSACTTTPTVSKTRYFGYPRGKDMHIYRPPKNLAVLCTVAKPNTLCGELCSRRFVGGFEWYWTRVV